MPNPKTGTGRRLTQDDIDKIVDLRLNCYSVREVADMVGCDKNTVMSHYNGWLDATSEERRERLERRRSEVIERQFNVASRARRGAERAKANADVLDSIKVGDDITIEDVVKAATKAADAAKDEARFLAEETKALVALSRIAGYDAPLVVEGRVGITDVEAREALSKLPSGSRKRLGLSC